MADKNGAAMRRASASVEGFLARVPGGQRRQDARRLCAMMQEITDEAPVMWGTSIIGFGTYHYRYASGREGDSPLAGFSPRSQHLAIYLVASSRPGTSRCWRGWARTRPGRAACTSGGWTMWTRRRFAS